MPAGVGLRLRTVASLRPRSRRYSQYRRSLRPCAARLAAAQDITELGINDLDHHARSTFSPANAGLPTGPAASSMHGQTAEEDQAAQAGPGALAPARAARLRPGGRRR